MSYIETLQTYAKLREGDRVQVRHEVKVGFRQWHVCTVGSVVAKERRRHSLHFDRNVDDKVFSDVLVLRKDDGELTTITLDEFTTIEKLPSDRAPNGDNPENVQAAVAP